MEPTAEHHPGADRLDGGEGRDDTTGAAGRGRRQLREATERPAPGEHRA